MKLKEIAKRTASVGLMALAVWGATKLPNRSPEFTPEFIKKHEYVAYDLDNDGSVDALGYRTTSNFAYAKPSVEDNRVYAFTKELTPEKEKVATAYFK